MIDIKLIRSSPENVRQGLKDRGGRYLPAFEELLEKDKKYRTALSKTEEIRAKHNKLSSEIGKARSRGSKLSASGEGLPPSPAYDAEVLKESLKAYEGELKVLRKETQDLLLGLPNPPHESAPKGLSPDDNRVVCENLACKRQFSFKPLDHQSIGETLGILDFAAAGKLSGSRFALLRGMGAGLERSLIQFMLDVHTKENGYTEIFPPFLVAPETMTGTGQLPKFEEELYKVSGDTPMYLIPTAEVPVTNLHRDAVLKEKDLPMKYAAYTACFRREAGSYGKDTRGLIRNHQFNKVELVWFTKPEDSMNALEELTKNARDILARLELPHRVVELCTGDLGFASAKTYDLEVWMPGETGFREVSSCSNCLDFQSRRINTRFKREGPASQAWQACRSLEFVHTLNGSGLAIGRIFAAILENCQNEDGSVFIPKVLKPYMGADLINKP